MFQVSKITQNLIARKTKSRGTSKQNIGLSDMDEMLKVPWDLLPEPSLPNPNSCLCDCI